jgi:hypothetical protein
MIEVRSKDRGGYNVCNPGGYTLTPWKAFRQIAQRAQEVQAGRIKTAELKAARDMLEPGEQHPSKMIPAEAYTLMDRFVQDPTVMDQMQDKGAVRMKNNGKQLPDLPWSLYHCSRPAWFPPDCFLWSDEPFPANEDLQKAMLYMRKYWLTKASNVGLGRSNLVVANIPNELIPRVGDPEDLRAEGTLH